MPSLFNRDLELHRRKLLAQSRVVLERYRIGPDLKARCGCTFCGWQDKHLSGVGLIGECDLAARLAFVSLDTWAQHAEIARLDAEHVLDALIHSISNPR